MQHSITLRVALLATVLLRCKFASASWWYLGLVSSNTMSLQQSAQRNADPSSRCTYEILSSRQQQMCRDNQNVLEIVRKGASLGIEECQLQFKYNRWNCTTFNSTNVFGKIVHFRSKETAYVYGISSAGVTWSMTRSCAKGEVPSLCGCARKPEDQNGAEGGFQWGGCDDDIKYGESFSRDFVDSREQPPHAGKQRATALMNLWNNEAGRRIVRSAMRKACKCHGVSGSCTNKICWHQLTEFKLIGAKLKERLESAKRVRFRNGKLRPATNSAARPTKADLVYLDESPEYCVPNVQYGIIGTRGRECNRTSSHSDGCAVLCCGRGFYPKTHEYQEECECKFIWCCHVLCKMCKRTTTKYYCL